MHREDVERTISNLSEAVLKALDAGGEIKETELFTSAGNGFQIHFIPYRDTKMTDTIAAEMNRRNGALAAHWRGRYEGMIEALRKTHTPKQIAEMGIVL